MKLLSYYWPNAPWMLVYMLQQTEYNPWKFMEWLKSVPNLLRIRRRGTLDVTSRVKLMLVISYGSWFFALALGLGLAWTRQNLAFLLLSLLAPFISVLMLFISTLLLQKLLVDPAAAKEIQAAKKKLDSMNCQKIAVLGSYGKTTMKELLVTVLSEAKKVAATPGNKNVLISHARWVNKNIKGDEEILIFEYGESAPGDIERLAGFSTPDIAVITGIAPAHLDGYSSVEAIADDFASISKTTGKENIYVNGNSELLREKISGNFYNPKGIANLTVKDIKIDYNATSFTLDGAGKKLHLYSGLLGSHQIGPLCAVIAIALRLGLNEEQITNGVAATMPYEHRMQPHNIHGAWLIDDTYNGNIEGMRAGLQLLQSLPGKRKVYVTPGLVDQGVETERVHLELGSLIAQAAPDRVVLMQNSATEFIRAGMNKGNYQGEVTIETDPLNFYTNIEHFLAAGDVVLMQNDWPDSYK